jgi:dihydroneopterin aldolase
MDRIIVSGAHFSVHLGVPPHERSVAQEVVLDIEAEFDVSRAGATDHFSDTVDYASIHAAARQAATGRPYALVEAMAESVAAAVLEHHPVASVRVLIRKPGALRDRGVDWAGVEITRRRP